MSYFPDRDNFFVADKFYFLEAAANPVTAWYGIPFVIQGLALLYQIKKE